MNDLQSFDSSTPRTINSSVGVTGLQSGEVLLGIDFRLTGASFGFDFNPTVDRIRVVSDSNQNLRLNPDSGALAATDTSLAFDAADFFAGQDPNLVGLA